MTAEESIRLGNLAQQSWNSSATGGAGIPGGTVGSTSSGGGATQDRANIDFLLNPNFNTFETETNAAEKAVAGGVSGSGWAGNVRSNMLDSERIKRMQLGNQMLEPYLNREFQGGQAAADRAQRAELAIMEGNQAMERLRLSEAGETARLSQSERARLEEIAAQGRISMQELMTREAGETGRQNASIRGNLANTLLSKTLNIDRDGEGGSRIPTTFGTAGGRLAPGQNWANTANFLATAGSETTGGPAPLPRSRGITGVGSSGIDRILQQYGLLGGSLIPGRF
jgi:hypothetical protein